MQIVLNTLKNGQPILVAKLDLHPKCDPAMRIEKNQNWPDTVLFENRFFGIEDWDGSNATYMEAYGEVLDANMATTISRSEA